MPDTEMIPVSFIAKFETDDDTSFNTEFGEVTYTTPPLYEGPYTVTPSSSEQTLLTNAKLMEDDVTVHEIPYYETSNPQGGNTVYIGTEITIN